MIGAKSRVYRALATLTAAVCAWTLLFVGPAAAQTRVGSITQIEPGTTIPVRTTEDIESNDSDGRVYRGVVDQDVRDNRGNIAIPRGSDVELVVRQTSDEQLVLDIDSIVVDGRRYGVETEETAVTGERKEGIGINKRTGKYVGGGALLGAVIGAIAGGGKGAAIGAGAGAAAGAGAQVLTRGKKVEVPDETLLTFRVQEPLRPISDSGYYRNGNHYHRGYGNDPNDSELSSQTSSRGILHVDRVTRITWQNAPPDSRVYVITDNSQPRYFGEGASGTMDVSSLTPGHRYVFVLQDRNGNEIDRQELDLRRVE